MQPFPGQTICWAIKEPILEKYLSQTKTVPQPQQTYERKEQKGKVRHMRKPNNIRASNQQVKEKVPREIRKHFESSQNKATTYQDIGDVATAVFRRRVMVANA